MTAAPSMIPGGEFRELIAGRARRLLQVAGYLERCRFDRPVLNRRLLGELLHQATEVEEVLDAYGARKNDLWRPFRSTIAAAKLFTGTVYVLLHIRHSVPAYRLLAIEGDFAAATDDAIIFAGDVILRVAQRLLARAREIGLPLPDPYACLGEFEDGLPPGALPADHVSRGAAEAAEVVTRLATAFLNLAAESDLLHVPIRVPPQDYVSCVPQPVSEEELRQLQHKFHNLQSAYDTFVADTDTERQAPDLLTLRGHVSVIFHLLRVATDLCHYYERHVMTVTPQAEGPQVPVVEGEALLHVLMRYALIYASRYLLAGRDLCQSMLKRFAEVGRVEVSGPRYRGFHVRPSTLIAKIVQHYGSEVQMEVDGETYDASSPMDIFRVNERISAQKRRWLIRHVTALPIAGNGQLPADPVEAARRVVLALAEQGKVVVYQQPLPIQPPAEGDAADEPLERVMDEVKRLQAVGAIDIDTDIRVAFVGDGRVLKDLKLLAESGYGEDNFGNNTPLPKELSYLRR